MKGAYLTMLKRKSSTIKTLQKSKPISHFNCKKTVKKNMTKSYGRGTAYRNQVVMKDKNSNNFVFNVYKDKKIFESRVIIPSIEMYYDNDN